VTRGAHAHDDSGDAGKGLAFVARVTHFIRTFLFLLATAAVSACSDSSSTPTSPSPGSGTATSTAGQVAGTWTLASIQPEGQPVQITPGAATYTLTLGDGMLSTRADCNTCNGAFTLAGQTITAGPQLACTRAACATMAFESAYTSILAGQSTVAVSSGTLVLSSPRGILRFTR
jgi:heat shock protein HslJ